MKNYISDIKQRITDDKTRNSDMHDTVTQIYEDTKVLINVIADIQDKMSEWHQAYQNNRSLDTDDFRYIRGDTLDDAAHELEEIFQANELYWKR